MEFPHFFNKSNLLNEMQIYAAFFKEFDLVDYSNSKLIVQGRVWRFGYGEKSFLAGKPVLRYTNLEATLYDYSKLATTEITNENLNNFENSYGVISHDLLKENLGFTKIKEILANNAKALIQAEKIEKQIEKLKALQDDF